MSIGGDDLRDIRRRVREDEGQEDTDATAGDESGGGGGGGSSGGGGDTSQAPTGTQSAISQTPEQIRQDSGGGTSGGGGGGSSDGGGGGGASRAPSGAQSAINQTPEQIRQDNGGGQPSPQEEVRQAAQEARQQQREQQPEPEPTPTPTPPPAPEPEPSPPPEPEQTQQPVGGDADGGGAEETPPPEQGLEASGPPGEPQPSLPAEQERQVDRLQTTVGGAVSEAEEAAAPAGLSPEQQRQVDRLQTTVGGAISEAEGLGVTETPPAPAGTERAIEAAPPPAPEPAMPSGPQQVGGERESEPLGVPGIPVDGDEMVPGAGPPDRPPRAGAAPEGPTPAAEAGLFLEDIFFEGPGTPDVTDVDEDIRGATAAGISIAFQQRTAEDIQAGLGLPVGDEFAITGPGVSPEGLEGGPTGEVDREIIADVFGTGGFLPQELPEGEEPVSLMQAGAGLFPGVEGGPISERSLREEATAVQERFSQEAPAEAFLTGIGAPEEAVQFGGGVANLPGEAAALPATTVFAGEQVVEFGENVPGTVEMFGAPATAATLTEAGARTGAGLVGEARENPFAFGGELAGEVLFGTAAFRGIERGAQAARSARVSGPILDVGDVTTERGVAGELPQFETPRAAPTREAVEEVRERAADQPTDLQEAFDVGEGSFLLRSEDQPLPSAFEAEAGEFELPGLFASPELSPLRLTEGAERSGLPGIRLGLPRVRGRGEQVTVFPGERIEGMPESARGFGFAVEGPGGEIIERGVGAAQGRRLAEEVGGRRIPDPETTGAQFLTGEAEPGTAFVRPVGSRTTELEAVFPPGSAFEEVGEFGVRMGPGRVVPGAAFRRADVDVEDVGDIEDLTDAFDGDIIPGTSVPETRIVRQADDVTVPPGAIPTTGAPTATGTPTPTGLFGGISTAVPPGAPTTAPPSGITDPTGLFTGPSSGGPVTEPPTAPPSGGPTTMTPPSGGPFTSPPPTGPPTSAPPPSEPPTTPPTFGPPAVPPTSAPPTGPPSSPPGIIPGGPSSPPGVIPGLPSGPGPGTPPLPTFEAPPDQPEPEDEPLFGPRGARFSNPFQTAEIALERGFQGFGGGGGLFGEGAMDSPPGTGASRSSEGAADQAIPNPFE